MFLGQGMRLLVQAIYFVIIARSLGVQNYGAFVGVTALTSIAVPFVGNGAASLLVKNVSRDRSLFAEYWGNGIVIVFGSGAALSLVVLGIARFALPQSIPTLLIAVICVSDVIFLAMGDLAGLAFQAVERLDRYAQLNVLATSSRLVAIAALATVVHRPTALQWGYLYLISTLVSTSIAMALVCKELGYPQLALCRFLPECREGFYFSIGLSARTIYNDVDKTMLARLSTLDATGIYGAAYRLIDVSFTPIRSLLCAAYPRFFQHGASGLIASFAFAKRLMWRAVVVSLMISMGIIAMAPIVPHILGGEYARTVEALRWLALLPFLKTIHHLTADALTGAGRQGLRTFIQVCVAVVNVLVNLWIIPAYGWRGAAWSSLASDGLLAVTMVLSVTILTTREHQLALAEELHA
jgi:O-antigen/teichoic acid export membrane protein